MTIGVTQASWAPASSSAGDGVGQRLAGGVVDVGLEQDDRLARRRRGSAAALAEHHLGDVGQAVDARRSPAPKPVAAIVMGGSGPEGRRRWPARRAAPVGVVSSTATSRP